jgi:hypothetical protein
MLQVSFGLMLCIGSHSLGRLVVSDGIARETATFWHPREMAQAAMVFVGLLCLLHGVVSIGQTGAQFGVVMNWITFGGGGGIQVLPNWWTLVLVSGVPQAAIGITLLFGSRFLSHWFAPRRDYSVREEIHDQT